MWLTFIAIVLALLVLDLGVLHKKSKEIGVTESLLMSAFYVTLGILFAGFVWSQFGKEASLQYLTGFVIEKSLAMDNIFVIAMIFGYFSIPREYQHRVLLFGILGVIVLRGIMIAAVRCRCRKLWMGSLPLRRLPHHHRHQDAVLEQRALRCREQSGAQIPAQAAAVTERLHGQKFLVRENDPATGKLKTFVTPLLLALIMIEFADLVFAVDSIPPSSPSPRTRSSSTRRTSSRSWACARFISRSPPSSTASPISSTRFRWC